MNSSDVEKLAKRGPTSRTSEIFEAISATNANYAAIRKAGFVGLDTGDQRAECYITRFHRVGSHAQKQQVRESGFHGKGTSTILFGRELSGATDVT